MMSDSNSGQVRGFLPWKSDSKRLYNVLTHRSRNISRTKNQKSIEKYSGSSSTKSSNTSFAIISMYMPLPPVDFRARYAPKAQSLVPPRSCNKVACDTDVGSSAGRPSGSSLLSTSLSQLEQTRDMALKVQDEIQILWTTLTHNSSPTRSTLPHLDPVLYSMPMFCRLRCLIDHLDISITSWMEKDLKPEYPDAWGFPSRGCCRQS